ncbi:hypothetical protein [Notoacmeibacter sp. MSK16QG-6]|uniref:hypothetical protein n=1 Tax=Notoacmeibacter sp. MSK16QG-6 TaxID=2957982 RepID=UPI00209EE16E|nr:hypothetical protein [Notoacmeibacter sp. MSK16QG-6]MCP1198643.1 hypothetical protein [Notoacmeibacter sp. MSK16QG-6]
MDAIGKAIRTALTKGNAADPAHRERVYQSAQHALESALDKEGVTDPMARDARRQRLVDSIAEIEKDYMPATAPSVNRSVPPDGPRAEPTFDLPQSEPDMAASPQWTAAVAPEKQRVTTGERLEPTLDAPAGETVDTEVDIHSAPIRMAPDERADGAGKRRFRRDGRKRRDRESDGRPRRKPFVWFLLISTVVVFVLIGVGFWVVSNADYEFVLEQFLEEVEPGEDYTPEARLGSSADDRTQFVLYDAGNRSIPSQGGELETSIVETGQAMALHVTGGGSDNDAVIIPIGREQLADLAGLPFTVAVRASSTADDGAALLVSCDFAGLGDCGNRRYKVEATAGDLLFAGRMGEGSPEDDGEIRIAVPEAGSEVDLLSVILLVGDT